MVISGDMKEKVAVLGGGSWATALVKILIGNGHSVYWWMRNETSVDHIIQYHHNPNYLSSVFLPPDKVFPSTDLEETLGMAKWIIVAVPSAFIEQAFGEAKQEWFKNKKIISGVKGIVYSKSQLITDWFSEQFDIPAHALGAIAGPCHAEEVASEKDSYLTIASSDSDLATNFAKLLSSRYIKTNTLNDIAGVEYAAVIKNIIALACGIAHGLGAGDNFQAVLVSNAIIEIDRFLSKAVPEERNINISAYLGDLLVTSYSQFSRNRTFGTMIGRGYSLRAAKLETKMIAEGYYATQSIYKINEEYRVHMPIVNFVYNILYEHQLPRVAFNKLKDNLV